MLQLTKDAFCFGISGKNDAKREQQRSKLSEQVREIMKRMLDARSMLKEDPPTKPTTSTSAIPFTDAAIQVACLRREPETGA